MLDYATAPPSSPRAVSTRIRRGFVKELLAELIEESGLDVSHVARRAGISNDAIWGWLAGRANPQIDYLRHVMEVLEKPISAVVQVPEDMHKLSDLRNLAGLTQPELATAIGVATSTLSEMERGNTLTLPPRRAVDLAKALRVEVDQVYQAFERTRNRPYGEPA